MTTTTLDRFPVRTAAPAPHAAPGAEARSTTPGLFATVRAAMGAARRASAATPREQVAIAARFADSLRA